MGQMGQMGQTGADGKLDDAGAVHRQVEAVDARRTAGGATAFSGSLRAAGRPEARGPGQLLLRARGTKIIGPSRLGRRLEARVFRWEYKGKGAGPRRRAGAAPAVRVGAREPAAAGGLRPRALSDRHQLDQHGLATDRAAARGSSPTPALDTLRGSCRSGAAEARSHPAADHRRRAREFGGTGPRPARPRPSSRTGGAVPGPARVLHVRRGQSASCPADADPHAGGGREQPSRVRKLCRGVVPHDGDRRLARLRPSTLVRRRTVRGCRRAAGAADGSAADPGGVGRRRTGLGRDRSRRSSARCSCRRSTPSGWRTCSGSPGRTTRRR